MRDSQEQPLLNYIFRKELIDIQSVLLGHSSWLKAIASTYIKLIGNLSEVVSKHPAKEISGQFFLISFKRLITITNFQDS
ncbi:hypothetical protein NEOC65_000945 [Neochlamydia sp. AcF65]|nr:hypothetical protein [Neochlamydia sp. AcF65]